MKKLLSILLALTILSGMIALGIAEGETGFSCGISVYGSDPVEAGAEAWLKAEILEPNQSYTAMWQKYNAAEEKWENVWGDVWYQFTAPAAGSYNYRIYIEGGDGTVLTREYWFTVTAPAPAPAAEPEPAPAPVPAPEPEPEPVPASAAEPAPEPEPEPEPAPAPAPEPEAEPAPATAPTTDVEPVEEAAPAEENAPVTEAPAEEAPAEEAAPAEEDASGEEAAPPAENAPAEDGEPAEEGEPATEDGEPAEAGEPVEDVEPAEASEPAEEGEPEEETEPEEGEVPAEEPEVGETDQGLENEAVEAEEEVNPDEAADPDDSEDGAFRVNVREEPNGLGVIIATLTEDTEVTVVSVDGDWVTVMIDGELGYIYLDDYVDLFGLEMEEPAEEPEVIPKKVTIFTSCRDVMEEGEPVVLTSKLEGFEDCDGIRYIWKVDKGNGYEEIEGANEATYTFPATMESLSWSWHLTVICY